METLKQLKDYYPRKTNQQKITIPPLAHQKQDTHIQLLIEKVSASPQEYTALRVSEDAFKTIIRSFPTGSSGGADDIRLNIFYT